jgi:hypothetical protein
MIRSAVDIDHVPCDPGNRGDNPNWDARRLEARTLLNVQLQRSRDRAPRTCERRDSGHDTSNAFDRIGKCLAMRVCPAQVLGQQIARQAAAADSGNAKIRWFLGQKIDHFQGVLERYSPLVQAVRYLDGAEYTDDAIKATTSGDGVRVRADDQGGSPTGCAWSPTNQVTGGINLCGQTRHTHLLAEPYARLLVPRRERTSCPAWLIGIVESAQRCPVRE